MELSGMVRMRYDPERRAAIMAWLVQQGVEITNIPHLAKHSPTPQASEGGPLLSLSCFSDPPSARTCAPFETHRLDP